VSPARLAAVLLAAGLACKAKNEPPPAPPPEPKPEDLAPDESAEPPAAEAVPEDPYAGLSEEQKTEKAKEFYAEAEVLAGAGTFDQAADKYEQAYYLVPGKHGFAFKVGVSAHKAGQCDRAVQYLQHFVTYAEPDKYGGDLKKAKKLLAQGCGK
jgi:hypothetical protein